ncbi:MAG: polysaccharide biosynthesis protein [Nitrosomonadales bacterium]
MTGAGGSIGAELCRQIAHFEPGMLVLYEQSEFALYSIEQELQENLPKLRVNFLSGMCEMRRDWMR